VYQQHFREMSDFFRQQQASSTKTTNGKTSVSRHLITHQSGGRGSSGLRPAVLPAAQLEAARRPLKGLSGPDEDEQCLGAAAQGREQSEDGHVQEPGHSGQPHRRLSLDRRDQPEALLQQDHCDYRRGAGGPSAGLTPDL